jgi:hypothetical protein
MKSLANAKGQSTTAAGHKPGSLLAQWKLVEAAVRDRRLSRGDIAVLFRVVDNYYHLYGNSRVAHSYLAAGTGLSRRAVISSTKRLRALGYLEVARIGSGTRPTEYAPNWQMHPDFTPIRGEAQITSEVASASLQESPAVNATSPKPAYVAGLQAGLRNQGPAPPPPLGGPDEPPAAPARDPFDELWNVYGRKHERNKAKAEYQKLDPDATLHAKIVQAAAEWRAAYEAQERPKKYWKCLHTWLAGECWLEELKRRFGGRLAVVAPHGANQRSNRLRIGHSRARLDLWGGQCAAQGERRIVVSARGGDGVAENRTDRATKTARGFVTAAHFDLAQHGEHFSGADLGNRPLAD